MLFWNVYFVFGVAVLTLHLFVCGGSLFIFKQRGVQYRTKHQPTGIWVDCGDGIYPTMAHMVLECAPLVGHFFRVRAHNEMGWSDWSQASEGLVTLRRH